eukprot:g33209.t1
MRQTSCHISRTASFERQDVEPDEEETLVEEPEDEDEPALPAKKAKALPARGAIAKAKAKGKAKAKAKAAVKAKAKAGPARGVIKAAMKAAPKAKAKAIAAKEFADVAAKLKKTKSKETVAGEGQWFHFYRVASIHQTRGGAVRIEAEDGTRLLVQDETIILERQWFPKDFLPRGSTGTPPGVLKIIRAG